MFDIRLIRDGDNVLFDRHLPIFNWPYPFDAEDCFTADPTYAYRNPPTAPRRRAVYVHIPFCETICGFCPFSKELYRSEEELDIYLDALICEMRIKRALLGRFRVDAIFIGGGTPSLLNLAQIERLGDAVAEHFELDASTEFTCEIEVKSIDKRKVATLRDVGVNRVSFGAQTFSKRYRKLFGLDASPNQIIDASAMVRASIDYTNCDLLYGMAGQTRDEVEEDLLSVTSLNTTSIDVYPINNLSASNSVHRSIRNSGQRYLAATERMHFRALLERALRGMGYAPISGYGFARAENLDKCADDPVQHSPKFVYHDLVYGHHDDEIIGYGSSAFSRVGHYNVHNYNSRTRYVRALLGDRRLPQLCFGEIGSPERGIVSFPFRGELKKSQVPWNSVPEETLIALQDLVEAKMVVDRGDTYVLSYLGWLFYVNAMFYLMPRAGKEWISRKIEELEGRGRRCGDPSLFDFQLLSPETASQTKTSSY